METEQLIPAEKFCTSYNVSISLIRSLTDVGLIETVIVDQTEFIQVPHLPRLERLVRLHDDLEINIEGVEVVDRLLGRIEQMQQEMLHLRNRLLRYEHI